MRYLLVATLLLLAACGGGGGDESASDAAEEMFSFIEKGQHGRRWDMLHPAQQAVVPKDKFIDCSQSANTVSLSDAKAIEEFDEPINVPRVGDVDTRAVTLEYKVGETTQHVTIHLIDVDGDWKWSMPEENIAAVESGNCP